MTHSTFLLHISEGYRSIRNNNKEITLTESMKNIPHGTKLLILERFVEGKDIRRHMHEKIYMCTHTPGPKPLRLKAKWQMTDQQTI